MSAARVREIRTLRASGLTFREIGDRFGMSRQRAHQLAKPRPAPPPPQPWPDLTPEAGRLGTRAARCLRRLGYARMGAAADDHRAGRLVPRLFNTPGCGLKTIAVITGWLERAP